MDWIRERSFQNWVIGILIVLNMVSLAVVWVHIGEKSRSPGRPPRGSSGISVELLRDELGLSPDQVAQFEKLRGNQLGAMKEVNDELDSLKLVLVDDMFSPSPDKESLNKTVEKIGSLQANLEMLRFKHFDALTQICDKQQRERLQPILREAFAKQKAPSREAAQTEADKDRSPRLDGKGQHGPAKEAEPEQEKREERDQTKPPPPSLNEKLDRYAQRLSLTEEQKKEAGEILKSTRTSEESFKARKPARDDFEREKERLRSLEDQRILNLLNSEQKAEFEKMLKRRGVPPR
jgi:hypothetical protein